MAASDRLQIKRSALFGALAGFIPFIFVLWDFGLNPLRTAGAHRFASNFYDLQGRALLDGNLSLPSHSLGIEGFVIDGRTYMYFPPFPALLRLPVLLVTDRFDGRLTAPSMLLAWAVLTVATAVLMWNVRFLVRGTPRVTKTESVLMGLLLASVTGGSVVLFLAALPWVYHEVYIWGSAFTVATLAGLVLLRRRPSLRVAFAIGVLALGAILTRTTSGWAMTFTILAAGVLMLVRESDEHHRRRIAIMVIAAGFVPLVIGAAINYAKFRHPFMFPLQNQEWTRVNSRRRLALRMNGGDITGPQFFLTALANYFKPSGIRFVPYVPFVTLPAQPARPFGGAFLDQWYRTGSVPTFMPLLFGTALWGFATTFRRRASAATRGLWLPLLGALAVTGGVMFYGYLAHRYISEFLPVLIIGAVIGFVDIGRRLDSVSRRIKKGVIVAVALATAYGVFANGATAFTSARVTWRGDRLEQFVTWQYDFGRRTGHIDDLVAQSDALPTDGPADRLQIVGDCNALYLATGDDYEPWVTVQVRDLHVAITAEPDGYDYGLLPLIAFDGRHSRRILVESDGDGHIRLRVGEGFVFYPTEWVDFEPGDSIEVHVNVSTERDRFYIRFGDIDAGYVAAAETNGNLPSAISVPRFDTPSWLDQGIVGLQLESTYGPRLKLCEDLLAELDSPSG